jgi:transcriptional regulator with XRE-family HTH domain
MITSEQIRAARALLRIEQDELAHRARVSATTIRRIEAVNGVHQVSEITVGNVMHTLEEAGAEFIEAGVRRRPAQDNEAAYRTLRAIAEQSARLHQGVAPITDADLYDEDGLPV